MRLVVGATGTVGRKVIDDLLTNWQIPVRALARGKSDWEGSLLPGFRRRGVEVVVGDIRSESTIERAVQDCKAIVNCAGIMRAAPDADIESVNLEGLENLVQKGQAAGVQRFIQLSCLGVTEHATSPYFSCKWDAEEAIRKSKFYWTIFRPSLIFDENSSLFRILDFWVLRSPLIFVVGSGLNRFQPISAVDVASCMVKSIYDRDTVGKIYELPGPETIDLQSLLTLMAERQGRTARTLRIPSFLGVPLAGLIGKLNPNSPIDNNVMNIMTSEMIGEDAPMLERFAIRRLTINTSFKAVEKKEDKPQEAPEPEDTDEPQEADEPQAT
jgi:NADH dehydrogenase